MLSWTRVLFNPVLHDLQCAGFCTHHLMIVKWHFISGYDVCIPRRGKGKERRHKGYNGAPAQFLSFHQECKPLRQQISTYIEMHYTVITSWNVAREKELVNGYWVSQPTVSAIKNNNKKKIQTFRVALTFTLLLKLFTAF